MEQRSFEVRFLEGKVRRLEREVAKLRDQKADAYNDMVNARLDADALQAENHKLRELVRDMHKALFSLNLDHCQACPREDACVFVHRSFDCDECAFEHDMRELGIEVD